MKISRILMATAALAMSATGAMAQYSLTILHTNDFHARFEPISKYDSGCSVEDNTEGNCFAGSARMATAIAEARLRSDNVLLVDGGDQFQGTLFYTYYKGKAAAEMMNAMGYDAMTVGNHEFDDGPEVLRGFMDALNFPVVSSNTDVTNEALLAGILKPFTILEKNGEKIGIIGLTPQDTDELASPGKGISFIDPVVAVQTQVDMLTAMGINKIVVLSHSGYEVEKRVAAETTGVDVIVGGHSHTLLSNTNDGAAGPYPTMVGNTAVVQSYAYGKYLGELNVVFDDDGNIITAIGDPILTDGSIAEDAGIKARVLEMSAPLEEIRTRVVASTSASIDGDRANCRARECQMGNLVADAMLDRVANQGVTIAIQNGGGLRASIDSGEVTMGEVLLVLPFQNTLATMQLSGAGVIAALESGVSQVEEGKGRFPQVAGIRFTLDVTVAPNEGRVSDVLVQDGSNWVPIDPDAIYGVVTNNYMRSGGDGYKVFATDGMNAYDYGPGLEDVVADYMAAGGAYTPYLDGRISQ